MKQYLVKPGEKVNLSKWDPNDKGDFEGGKIEGRAEVAKLNDKLEALQELLYAEHKHKVLVVLQAMDTGGKDGVIRRVFDGVNPQGVRVASFKVPTREELNHDYLWRVHKVTPGKGQMVIFNRSHYEDVLVVRVHKLVPLPYGKSASIKSISSSVCWPRTGRPSSNSICILTWTNRRNACRRAWMSRIRTGSSAWVIWMSENCGLIICRLMKMF